MDLVEVQHRSEYVECRLLTINDAAEYLAVSRGAIYALLDAGTLGSVHIGRARRVPLAELRRFVRESTRW
jgi:excisionase family DNA binding protein